MRFWVAMLALVVASVPPATAEVFPVDIATGAMTVANQMVDDPGLVRSATFLSGGTTTTGPPYVAGTPGAWANATVTPPFSFIGSGFGILSNGGADWADDKMGLEPVHPAWGTVGNVYRGANDATVLAIGLSVPEGKNCLQMSFQFLSEEYPAWVNQTFNDGFIAELDNHTWYMTASNAIIAPDNFATDASGNFISVNSPIGFSAANGAGSIYSGGSGTGQGGASPMMTARTEVDPGVHTLYLSIFDGYDPIYDSTVFVDNIHATVGDGSPECPLPATPPPPPEFCEESPLHAQCQDQVPPPPPAGRTYEHQFWPPSPTNYILEPVRSEPVASSLTAPTDSKVDSKDLLPQVFGDGSGVDDCIGPIGGTPDLDGDGIRDVCDDDGDGDGLIDEMDACPTDPDLECGVESHGLDVSEGQAADAGTFLAAGPASPGQGSVTVASEHVQTGPWPLLLLFGVLGLILFVAGRRRDDA